MGSPELERRKALARERAAQLAGKSKGTGDLGSTIGSAAGGIIGLIAGGNVMAGSSIGGTLGGIVDSVSEDDVAGAANKTVGAVGGAVGAGGAVKQGLDAKSRASAALAGRTLEASRESAATYSQADIANAYRAKQIQSQVDKLNQELADEEEFMVF